MQKAPKQEYTGTFIPAFIMLNKGLKPVEKIIYAEIASFEAFHGSNAWLVERVGVSTRTVQSILQDLEEKEYIFRAQDDKGNRVLIANRNDPRKICIPPVQNLHTPRAEFAPNNKEENKEEKNTMEAQALSQSATPPTLAPGLPFDEEREKSSAQKEKEKTVLVDTKTNESPTTNALHYRVIKKYGLPVSNHLHVKAKSKALDAEIGAEAAQEYLQLLLDIDYQTFSGEFKPTLNHSRDIYDKRIAICTFLGKFKFQRSASGKSAAELADEANAKRDWGF